jgi:hypothetical protein
MNSFCARSITAFLICQKISGLEYKGKIHRFEIFSVSGTIGIDRRFLASRPTRTPSARRLKNVRQRAVTLTSQLTVFLSNAAGFASSAAVTSFSA